MFNGNNALRRGLADATHHHELDDQESTGGFLSAAKQGFERQIGRYQDFALRTGFTPPLPGADAFGLGGALPPAFGQAMLQAPPPAPGAATYAEAYSELAQLAIEAHPIGAGLGAALAVAPPLMLVALVSLRLALGPFFGATLVGNKSTRPRR